MTQSVENPKEAIDVLLRACYPIVYVVSHEEGRVTEELKDVADDRNRQLLTWSCTKGLSGTGVDEEKLKDPVAMLTFIENYKEPSIFVAYDLHVYINDPFVKRKLRELAMVLQKAKKTLIILSPLLDLPDDLAKVAVVVDWPLPDEDAIGNILDGVVEKMSDRISIKFENGDREAIIRASMGLTAQEIDNVYSKSLVQNRSIEVASIVDEKAQIIRKSGTLEFYSANESLEDIGGMDNLKVWARKRGRAFSDKAREFGLPLPKGAILLGVQGCGKSLFSRALAAHWQVPLLRFDVGKVFQGLLGGTEEATRQVIATAEAISPCVLMIDEMEKGFGGGQSSHMTDGGASARVLSTFLTWQQEKTKAVFTVATCNSFQGLPPEMLRAGRFDAIFFIDLPTKSEREAIFEIKIQGKNRDPKEFDLPALADASSTFSGAEIEQSVANALFDVFDSDEEDDITTNTILRQLEVMVPLATTRKEDIDQLRSQAATRAIPASTTNEAVEEIVSHDDRTAQIDLS